MRYDDDAGVVKAVLDGDKDAFVFLVNRYQGAVYAYCLNQVPSEEDAKDITQEVLLKAYLKLGQLKTPHAFRSWLYTIALNECRMWHRKHRSHDVLEAETEPAPTTHRADLETRLTVKEEIDALPESQRLVILMHYFSGFSLKEIGEFLGTSREAIKARLFRARQTLGKRLKGTYEEYFDSSTKPNFCIAILDKITPLPKPSGTDSPISKAHRVAPLPVATVLSVVLFGGLAGLFPTGTDSGAPKGTINVSLVDADSDSEIELAQAETPKKRIDVPVKRAATEERRGAGVKTGTSPIQVIGGGRVDDIVASPDGKLFAIRSPYGLELHHAEGDSPPVAVDSTGRIESPTFSRDGRFLVWSGGEELKVWDIGKQETVATHSLDSLKRTFLFDIGLEFAINLDNRVVSGDLEDVFEEHSIRLSSPYFPRGAPRWHLADQDGRRIFDIREADGKLSVYVLHKRRWLDYLNIALHPKMKEVALGLPWQDMNESAFKIVFVDPVLGSELRSFEWSDINGLPIYDMQYSPDGEQLVVFEYDAYNSSRPNPLTPRLVFLNPRDGEILHELDVQDTDAGVTFAYSPGSQWFAYRAWRDKRIDVIDTLDWQVKKTFAIPDGLKRTDFLAPVHLPQPKTSISFSSDSRYLALGSMVWDFRTGDTVHAGEYKVMSQFLDDTHLLISNGASVKALDVAANRLEGRLNLQYGVLPGSAYFLSDNDTILAQGWGASLWKASTGNIVDEDVFGKRFDIKFSVVSPINNVVASVVTAKVPENATLTLEQEFIKHVVKDEMLIWSAQKREVIQQIPPQLDTTFFDVGTVDSKIVQQRLFRHGLGADLYSHVLEFSPNGMQLAVGQTNGLASLWDISEPKKLHRFDNFNTVFGYGSKSIHDRFAMVSALAFSPDGNQLACGVFDVIRIWDVNTGESVRALEIPKTPDTTLPLFLRFSKDGTRLFAGLMSGDFVVFDIASGTVAKTLSPGYRAVKAPHIGNSIPLDLNADTTLMAVGRTDNVIELISAQTWKRIAELSGHREEIRSVDFSHDGTKLVSTSRDGTMRVWNVEGL